LTRKSGQGAGEADQREHRPGKSPGQLWSPELRAPVKFSLFPPTPHTPPDSPSYPYAHPTLSHTFSLLFPQTHTDTMLTPSHTHTHAHTPYSTDNPGSILQPKHLVHVPRHQALRVSSHSPTGGTPRPPLPQTNLA
jgi:hypothetical protein